MTKKWVVAAKRADFDGIGKKYGISPYLARIIRNRDVIEDEDIDFFLNGTVDRMHDPALLKDIDIAADIIMDAIEAEAPIRIVGDYDIDGVMASYILSKGLKYLGADTDIKLPDRVRDGYGINESIIRRAAEDGIELIITCDNGISASAEVNLALELGMSIIVTDHHEVPYVEEDGIKHYIVPNADAVVNPKQEECQYPFDGICGAMVAYKLIAYLTRDDNSDMKQKLMEELLSFAAFATIGDVMELKDENRIAVKYGIELLKNTSNIGMKALINVVNIDSAKLSPYHIGFILGPCINATGRLDSAMRALSLLFSESVESATMIAQELHDLNESRKSLTQSFVTQAEKIVEDNLSEDRVLVLYLPDCHESIAGIVAGRIKEKYYKPTIVLTKDAEGGAKGSARSIETYNMYEELTRVKDIFTKYGGHKMAAGMSLPSESVDELRLRLNANCELTESDLVEKMVIDIPLPIGYVTRDLVYELDKLAPFGVSNPRPLFAQKNVKVRSVNLMGKNNNVLKMVLEGSDAEGMPVCHEAVLFENAAENYEKLKDAETISVLYQAAINEFRGTESVSLQIKDYLL